MPVLKKANVERIYLPSTKDEPNEQDRAWVDIKSKLVLNDVSAMFDKESTDMESAVNAVTALIVDWNYTDEQGVKLPIDVETVGLIDMDDFLALTDRLGSVLDMKEALGKDEKKGSTNTSTDNLTVLS